MTQDELEHGAYMAEQAYENDRAEAAYQDMLRDKAEADEMERQMHEDEARDHLMQDLEFPF